MRRKSNEHKKARFRDGAVVAGALLRHVSL